jgi:hypothetical protein
MPVPALAWRLIALPTRFNSSGSFATFAAILGCCARILEIDIRELLPAVVTHGKAGVQLLDRPGRREAAANS